MRWTWAVPALMVAAAAVGCRIEERPPDRDATRAPSAPADTVAEAEIVAVGDSAAIDRKSVV